MVVLSEIWDPRWSASVGGTSARVYEVDGLLRGIVVTHGAHEIVLRYPATVAKWTVVLYLVPFAALGLIWLGTRRQGRETNDHP